MYVQFFVQSIDNEKVDERLHGFRYHVIFDPKEALEFESLFLLWRTKPLTRPRRKDLLLTLEIRTNHFEAN